MLGLMTAVSTVLLVLFLHNELGSISGAARDRNLRVLMAMAEVCRESGGPGKSSAYRYFKSFIKTPETMMVSCADAGGSVFLSERYNTPYYRPSRYLPGSFRPPAAGNWVTVEDNGIEILKASIETAAPGGGRVSARVDFSTQSLYQKIEESLRSSLRRFAFVLSAAFAIGCLGALIIMRVVAAPIQALSAGAKMIGAGRFAHRIPVTRRDEMGRLAAEFNEMADRLARSEEMKRDLTSSITHDLRSPVTGIGLCADMVEALAAKKEHARIPEQLVSVREHLQRLNLFIDSLLEAARIDSGKAALSPRPVDLTALSAISSRSTGPTPRPGGCSWNSSSAGNCRTSKATRSAFTRSFPISWVTPSSSPIRAGCRCSWRRRTARRRSGWPIPGSAYRPGNWAGSSRNSTA